MHSINRQRRTLSLFLALSLITLPTLVPTAFTSAIHGVAETSPLAQAGGATTENEAALEARARRAGLRPAPALV